MNAITQYIEKNIIDLRTTYLSGVDNLSAVYIDYDKNKKKRNFKLLLYYLIVIVFNKHKKINDHNVTILSGKNQRFDANSERLPSHIYRGQWFDDFRDIINEITIVSSLGRLERIRVFFNAVIIALNDKELDIATWIDFYFLTYMLLLNEITNVNARGHYDECATWLGGLSEIIGFKYSVYQHGVVLSNTVIPHKYHCDEAFLFDRHSIDVFKESIIDNHNCKFIIHSFVSSVRFTKIGTNAKDTYIGLVEQNNPTWIEHQIHNVLSTNNKSYIFILKHPLSKQNYNESDSIIVTTKKIINLDIVITENSTLLLDYVWANYNGRLLFTSEQAKDMFRDYPSIEYADSDAFIKKAVKSGK